MYHMQVIHLLFWSVGAFWSCSFCSTWEILTTFQLQPLYCMPALTSPRTYIDLNNKNCITGSCSRRIMCSHCRRAMQVHQDVLVPLVYVVILDLLAVEDLLERVDCLEFLAVVMKTTFLYLSYLPVSLVTIVDMPIQKNFRVCLLFQLANFISFNVHLNFYVAFYCVVFNLTIIVLYIIFNILYIVPIHSSQKFKTNKATVTMVSKLQLSL